MTVTVLIPNWNGGTRLSTLVKLLSSQTYPIAEVIVADDGSTDGSESAAEALGARIVRLGSHKGFAAVVNRGLQECRSDLIALVNNDVTLDQRWLEELVEQVSRPGVWFGAGRTLNANNGALIDGTFDSVSRAGTAWRCGAGRLDGPLWRQEQNIEMTSFTAALFRKELFERVGPLDERFESYLEDVDFGLRCASKGYTGRYVPAAIAYHVGSATLGSWHPRTVRQIARNQLWLVAKHYPRRLLWKYGWAIAVGQLLWGVVAARNGAAVAWIRGKIEGLAGFGRMREGGDPEIERVLRSSEQLIHELQKKSGLDWYWRLYFALT
jgi:GT2 family glycosyltransferase